MTSKKRKSGKNLCGFLLAPFALILFFSIVAAQNPSESLNQNGRNIHQWGAISSFHGLPSDRVYAIAQSGDGVMWFGTERGLARYDGRRVQTIGAENFPAEKVLALKFAPDGGLWIGTQNGAFRIVKNQFQLIEKTAGKAISTILLAPTRGSIVLAGLQGQIFEVRADSENNLKTTEIPNQPLTVADNEPDKSLPITSLAVHNNILLAGTRRRGVLHLEEETKILGEVMSRPRAFFVNALAPDKNNNLWLGADAGRDGSGLFLANDIHRPERIGAGIGSVTALDFDADNDLWLGTAERGAFHFRGREQFEHFTFENTAGGLRSNSIFAVFVDRESVIWFGTDKGVFRFDKNAPRSELVSADAESNFVRTLFQMRSGKIFAGTNRGLFSRENSREDWHENSDFIGKTIFGIAETDDGRLLVGTANGLFVNGKLQSPVVDRKQDAESVRAIRQFQNKIYLAIYGRGVEAIENNLRPIVFPASEADARLREVTSLHAERNEKLWIGTAQSGVFIFDGKRFSQDAALADLKNAPVRAIGGDSEKGVWFATGGKGLFVYQNGKLENVLPETNARSVFLESNTEQPSVWTATDKGLFHLRFDQEFGWLRSRLEVEQGLPSQNIFALLLEPDGNLLIGTNRGVVRYQPNRIKPLLVPVRILSQRVHEPNEMATEIRLDFPQNSLAIEVAAQSSRTVPEQFQYAFSLSDSTGNLVKRKFSNDGQFLMENLKAGKYTVEAIAFDRDLQASEPLHFSFTVENAPFPWTAATLGALLAVALVALAFALWQRNKIWETSRQLTTARLDLANEAERERRRIARDLHDQTLADLRHLQLLTDKLGDGASGEAVVIRSEIENVSKEIRRICEDLSPSMLENIGFAAALEWALQTTASEGNFDFEFSADDDFEGYLTLAPSVQIQIYRIAQEVLHNICRHAAASKVRVELKIAEEFILTIEDDGKSFAPDSKTNGSGRGLNNIAARAALIESEINWQKLTKGTIFTLRRPNTVDNHKT
jgi:signal transduction histidine kinase/ligand-binding sensor domain-containing protein